MSTSWGIDNYEGSFRILKGNGVGTSVSTALTVASSTSFVGIGTSTPGALLAVQGTALAQAWNTFSDRNLKDNIFDLSATSSLEMVMALKPVSYTFKDGYGSTTLTRLGFIAQDVEGVVPSAVIKDNNGIFTMNYTELIAPTIKALQELNGKIFGSGAQQAISIEEITASSTISVDDKIKALGMNAKQVNDMLAQLASSTSATSSVTTTDVVTTATSSAACAAGTVVGTSMNNGIVTEVTSTTTPIVVEGQIPQVIN
jgi:hypothetical protein